MALTDAQVNTVINSYDFKLTSKATHEGRVFRLYCKQFENGAEKNTSTIHWVTRSEGGVVNWYNTGPTTVSIGGNKVLNKYPRPGINGKFPSGRNTYTSGSFTVNHKDSGAIDPLEVYITTAIYWGDWNLQTTDPITWKLRKINRYFSKPLSYSVTNLTETGCTITVSTSEPMSAITITETNQKPFSSSISYNSSKKKATITISNMTPGIQYNFKATATRSDSGLKSYVNITPTTYHYPYVIQNNKATVFPGDSVSVTVHNPLKKKITVYMGIKNNDTSTSSIIASETTTEERPVITFSPTAEKIYAKLPAAAATNVYYFCKTEDGHFSEKTNKGRISILGTEIPNIDNLVCLWVDSSESTREVTGLEPVYGTDNWMVQNKSELTTCLQKGATGVNTSINSYIFKLGNIEKVVLASDAYAGLEWGTLNLKGEQTLIITAIDARGLRNSTEVKIMFYPYEFPSASIEAVRRNNYGEIVDIVYGYKYSSVNNTNNIRLYYTITQKHNSYSTYYIYGNSSGFLEEEKPTTEEGFAELVREGVDNDYSAIFSIYIQDRFCEEPVLMEQSKIERGQPIFFIDEEQSGVGVNCFPSGEGLWLSNHAQVVYEDNSIIFRFK